jgi:hypothetical protein
VNLTAPSISCGFPTDDALDSFWNTTIPGLEGAEARGNFTDVGDLNSFYSRDAETEAVLKEFGERCVESDGAFLKYMGTVGPDFSWV